MSRLYSISCPFIHDVSARLSYTLTWPDCHYDIEVYYLCSWVNHSHISMCNHYYPTKRSGSLSTFHA
jgi:hypothetical protein